MSGRLLTIETLERGVKYSKVTIKINTFHNKDILHLVLVLLLLTLSRKTPVGSLGGCLSNILFHAVTT